MHPGHTIGTIWLHRAPVDFRKQINGLAAIVQEVLGMDPFAPALFVFTNRARTGIKVVYWDRNGFCLWHKRLERDRFAWLRPDGQPAGTLSLREFEWLLEGFDPWQASAHKSLNYKIVS